MTSLTLLVAKVPTAKSIPSNNTSYCGPIGGSGWQLAVDYCSPLTACPSGTPAECGNGWTCYSGIECSRSPEEVEENFDGDQYVAPSVDLQSETNSVPAAAEVTSESDQVSPFQVQSEPLATTEIQYEQNGSPHVTNEETIYHGPKLPVINAPGVAFGSEGDPSSTSQLVNGESAPEGASSPVGGDDCYCGHSADVTAQVARAYTTMIQDCNCLRKCVNGACPSGQMAFHGINCGEKDDHLSQTPYVVGSAESNEPEAPASVEKLEASTSNNPSVLGEPGQTSQSASGGQPSSISNGSVPSPGESSAENTTPQVGSDVEQAEEENMFFCGRCA